MPMRFITINVNSFNKNMILIEEYMFNSACCVAPYCIHSICSIGHYRRFTIFHCNTFDDFNSIVGAYFSVLLIFNRNTLIYYIK